MRIHLIVAMPVLTMLTACASDKKIPPPPQGTVIDVSQPADLSRVRELLDAIPQKQGYAKKVVAYRSSEDCAPVARFYGDFMRGTHWTELSAGDNSPADASAFTQSWKYMSRRAYIVGSTPPGGSGCTVMTAIYDKAHRNRYESQ